VTPDGYDSLESVFHSWLDSVTLATRRSADWWRDRIFLSNDGDLFCYAWLRDGEHRGYLVYDVEDGENGRRLRAHGLAYVDHVAYLNLLRFCLNHDSQVAEIELVGPGHDRLVDVVTDRDALELRTGADKMLRVVDVPTALEALSSPDAGALEVTLSVTDEQADWNDDTFAVTVEGG
jgi:predicted acetyltransferase